MPVPTDAMAAEARRGLEWRKEFNRGGTAVGVARARDIANKADLPSATIGRMVSFFARHEVDKQAEGFSPGEKGYPSAGRIAWALWGGEPGKTWANKEWDKIQAQKAAPDGLKVGDFVRWNSSGGTARGKIERVERNGSIKVPDSSFTIEGTEDNPAALIRVYRQGEDGLEATDTMVGHRFSTLTKIDKGNKMSGHKQIALAEMEFKFVSEERGSFKGYASVFNGRDAYNDTIEKGAYSDVIEGIERGIMSMPKMFINHRSWNVPVGKWTKMYEDERGLVVEGELTKGNPEAEVIKAALQHGTVDGLSIGFKIGDYEMVKGEDGSMMRVIKEVAELPEISIVTYPADDAARVDLSSVKSTLDNITSIKEFEDFLREAGGFSKSLATATASRAKRLFSQSESESLQLPNDLAELISANLKQSQTL